MEKDSFLFSCIAIFLVSTSIVSVCCNTTNGIGPMPALTSEKGYRFQLIHRHGLIPSPHQNSLLPTQKMSGNFTDSRVQGDFRAGVWADDKNLLFLVNISIGTPPTPQLIAMDLASPLLWVECSPCTNCTTSPGSRFDRLKSSSYSSISCADRSCYYFDDPDCDVTSGQCVYILPYSDKTIVKGRLASEMLTFTTSNDETEVREVKFGCTTDHRPGPGLHRHPLGGIFGLNYSPLSLIQQFEITRFSYCTSSVKEPRYPNNQLALGVSAHLDGYSTPLEIFRHNYYVKLENISIGDKMLNITFENTPDKGRVMIDTGATLTYVVYEAYEQIIRQVYFAMRKRYSSISLSRTMFQRRYVSRH